MENFCYAFSNSLIPVPGKDRRASKFHTLVSVLQCEEKKKKRIDINRFILGKIYKNNINITSI